MMALATYELRIWEPSTTGYKARQNGWRSVADTQAESKDTAERQMSLRVQEARRNGHQIRVVRMRRG